MTMNMNVSLNISMNMSTDWDMDMLMEMDRDMDMNMDPDMDMNILYLKKYIFDIGYRNCSNIGVRDSHRYRHKTPILGYRKPRT
jgi:hypothetical protein